MSAHQRRDSSGRIAGLQYPHVFVRIEFPIAHYDASDNIRARSITADGDCLTFEVGWGVDTFAYDKIGLQTVDHDRYDFDVSPAGNAQIQHRRHIEACYSDITGGERLSH